MLAMRCRQTKLARGRALQKKGVDDYSVKTMKEMVAVAGHKKATL